MILYLSLNRFVCVRYGALRSKLHPIRAEMRELNAKKSKVNGYMYDRMNGNGTKSGRNGSLERKSSASSDEE